MTDVPERIYCRIDANLTDTGEFLGTCWRDTDPLSTEYTRADLIPAMMAAAEQRGREAEREEIAKAADDLALAATVALTLLQDGEHGAKVGASVLIKRFAEFAAAIRARANLPEAQQEGE